MAQQARSRSLRQSLAASAGLHFDDEVGWLREVKEKLKAGGRDAAGTVKVFDVPRVLKATRPEAYRPQHFALGPYHCSRTELRDMERYKVAGAKRFADGDMIEQFANQILEMPNRIKAPYHRYLGLRNETLAWMMAIDTCFLLDFLEGNHGRRDKVTDMFRAANWINATIRDAMMLENQTPLFLFSEALALRPPTPEQDAAATLRAMLICFIKDVSPIEIELTPEAEDLVFAGIARHAHMLELLYHFLVPEETALDNRDNDGELPEMLPGEDITANVEKQLSKPWMSMAGLSVLDTMGKVPVLSPLVGMLKTICSNKDVKDKMKGLLPSTNSPLVDQIMIPSVVTLKRLGVRFEPTKGGIRKIDFNTATATLTLPKIKLDSNTEVVLRNLVAYEAVAVHGPLVLARYTELMNGIIDRPKDVKILRQSGVVVNNLRSDKEAADMWNGMCRATRVSSVSWLDDTIKKVNAYRRRPTAARAQKLLKKFVFRSWRMLTLLAAIVLLLMTAMQTFCSVYPCTRWLHIPQVVGGTR